MNFGEVKETGTSSELKRRIGSGFKITIILKELNDEALQAIKEFVAANVPSSDLYDTSGGALLFVVPLTATDEVTAFLKSYEGNK